MTIANFNTAKHIMAEINSTKGKIAELSSCLKRTEDTTGQCQEILRVQIGEQYCNTPKPEVRVEYWKRFLLAEIEDCENKIAELNEEFSQL